MKPNRIRILLLSLVVSALVTSCESSRTVNVSQGVARYENTVSAIAFVNKLKEEGKLPGLKPEDYTVSVFLPHSPAADANGFRQFEAVSGIAYGMNAARPQTNAARFRYIVSRPDQSPTWQLVEAWQIDADGINRVNLLAGVSK